MLQENIDSIQKQTTSLAVIGGGGYNNLENELGGNEMQKWVGIKGVTH